MKKIFLAGWLLISFSGMAQQAEAIETQVPDKELICVHGGWDCRNVASFESGDRETHCTAKILLYPDRVLDHIEDEEEKSRIMQNLKDCAQRYPERYFRVRLQPLM